VAIKGIGDWTAKVALQAAVNRYFYSGTGSVTARQVKETFVRYGAFGGLAACYTLMRRVLDVYPRGGRCGCPFHAGRKLLHNRAISVCGRKPFFRKSAKCEVDSNGIWQI
jgi:hypothetical protein